MKKAMLWCVCAGLLAATGSVGLRASEPAKPEAKKALSEKERAVLAAALALLKEPDVDERVRRAVGYVAVLLADASVRSDLAALLKDKGEDATVRVRIIEKLASFGDKKDLAVVLAVFADKEERVEVRYACARFLEKVSDESCVKPLVAILNDKTDAEPIRLRAAQALARLGDLSAAPGLRKQLKSDDPKERFFAARALAGLHDPSGEAIPVLVAAMQTPSAGGTWQAMLALGQLRDKRTVPALVGILNSNPHGRSKFVAQALARITLVDNGTDSEKWKTWWRENQNTFALIEPKAENIPVLIGKLSSKNYYVKDAAQRLLLEIGDPALAALTEEVRKGRTGKEIAGAFRVAGESGAGHLVALLKDEDDKAAENAGTVLATVGYRALENVADILRDKNAPVKLRVRAAAALGKGRYLSTPMRRALQTASKEPEKDLQAAAKAALASVSQRQRAQRRQGGGMRPMPKGHPKLPRSTPPKE